MEAGPSLALDLANTLHMVRGKTRDALPAWLAAHSNGTDATEAPEAPEAPDVIPQTRTARFTELRDGIRTLISAAIAEKPYPAEALRVVNTASAGAPFWLELDGSGHVEEKAGADGPEALFGTIARHTITLLGGAEREALRACQAPGCVQFFARTHPRQEFCGPACGNRARAARHYARHKDNA
ncbi:putative RNA-binding Zn ribbon-like protein [Catenulispora sp. GP43]|uniref:CGNR zinc finger domain-containing protein n=1 Tax=Catenulispora sp. GP43 TaxID=3156263 RepID=UPI003513484A